MKTLQVAASAILGLLAGCSGQAEDSGLDEAERVGQVAANLSEGFFGTVVETMNSSGYTYVLIDTGQEQAWAASPEIVVAVGDKVAVVSPMPMVDYTSPTLGRTFDVVYFTATIASPDKLGGAPAMPPGHPSLTDSTNLPSGGPATSANATTEIDFAGIARADGGHTVEEVYLKKDELVGSEVVLRGKVVKYNARILGKNWLHVQDGTGTSGTNDLTITTDARCAVGDTIVVRGILVADRDFGYGYQFDLIVEDAQLSVE